MRNSMVVEEVEVIRGTMAAQTDTMNSTPNRTTSTTSKPKTPRKSKSKDMKIEKREMSRERDEWEKQNQASAEMKARKAERRKLRLHYVRKAKQRLRRMEKSIENEGADDVEPTVPLDLVVREVTLSREITEVERIDKELQKHVDGIQTLCAKLRK
jgi:hypothetical protein